MLPCALFCGKGVQWSWVSALVSSRMQLWFLCHDPLESMGKNVEKTKEQHPRCTQIALRHFTRHQCAPLSFNLIRTMIHQLRASRHCPNSIAPNCHSPTCAILALTRNWCKEQQSTETEARLSLQWVTLTISCTHFHHAKLPITSTDVHTKKHFIEFSLFFTQAQMRSKQAFLQWFLQTSSVPLWKKTI